MTIVRKPAKSAGVSRPAAKPAPRPAAAAAISTDTAVPVASLAMPVQIFEAATSQAGDIQEIGRDMVLRSAESMRAVYDRTRIASEEAASSLEQAIATANDGVKKLHAKAIELAQSNTSAAFDFSKGLTATASPAEAMAFASDHYRKQIEAITSQSREFAGMTKKLMEDAMAPFGAAFSKTPGIRA